MNKSYKACRLASRSAVNMKYSSFESPFDGELEIFYPETASLNIIFAFYFHQLEFLM